MKARMKKQVSPKASRTTELELLQSDPFTFTAIVLNRQCASVPRFTSIELRRAFEAAAARRWAACVASHVPTLGHWRAGPASSAMHHRMHPGLPRRPQLAKIVAIRRRGRSGWRMRHCERTKSERASWPGFCQANWANARACAAPTEHRAAASWWALRSLAGLSTGN